MKKKIIIGVVAVFIVIATFTTVILINQDTISINDICWEHVTNMNVMELEDGTVKVTLTAPDFVSLVKLLYNENNDTVTSKNIAKAVKNNPECAKEYVFIAASSLDADIKSALMEQISYELTASTLEGMIGV